MTGSSSETIASTSFPSWLHEQNEFDAASSIRVDPAWPVLVAGSAVRRIALQHSSLRARKISFAFGETASEPQGKQPPSGMDAVNASEKLLAQLADLPTPAGPAPRPLQRRLVQIEPTRESREGCQRNGLISKA
jgi:hypothetical protein